MTEPKGEDRCPRSLWDHYRRLWFYNFHRFEGDNARQMRDYFARVAIGEIEQFLPLAGCKVLDVGGARGEFCAALHRFRGCDATNLEIAACDFLWDRNVIASADAIPFADSTFDAVVCRGVIEHIPPERQLPSLREIRRVLKPGGVAYLVIPPWYNPHAGHRLKPFHALPFPVAKFLRQAIFRKKVAGNNRAQLGLHPVTFARMRRLVAGAGLSLLATRDTHFRLHFLTALPIVRELFVPAVAFLATKRLRPAPRGRAEADDTSTAA
jgi:SAM-dependent methyltransferase